MAISEVKRVALYWSSFAIRAAGRDRRHLTFQLPKHHKTEAKLLEGGCVLYRLPAKRPMALDTQGA
jgi:hypothetical protein